MTLPRFAVVLVLSSALQSCLSDDALDKDGSGARNLLQAQQQAQSGMGGMQAQHQLQVAGPYRTHTSAPSIQPPSYVEPCLGCGGGLNGEIVGTVPVSVQGTLNLGVRGAISLTPDTSCGGTCGVAVNPVPGYSPPSVPGSSGSYVYGSYPGSYGGLGAHAFSSPVGTGGGITSYGSSYVPHGNSHYLPTYQQAFQHQYHSQLYGGGSSTGYAGSPLSSARGFGSLGYDNGGYVSIPIGQTNYGTYQQQQQHQSGLGGHQNRQQVESQKSLSAYQGSGTTYGRSVSGGYGGGYGSGSGVLGGATGGQPQIQQQTSSQGSGTFPSGNAAGSGISSAMGSLGQTYMSPNSGIRQPSYGGSSYQGSGGSGTVGAGNSQAQYQRQSQTPSIRMDPNALRALRNEDEKTQTKQLKSSGK